MDILRRKPWGVSDFLYVQFRWRQKDKNKSSDIERHGHDAIAFKVTSGEVACEVIAGCGQKARYHLSGDDPKPRLTLRSAVDNEHHA